MRTSTWRRRAQGDLGRAAELKVRRPAHAPEGIGRPEPEAEPAAGAAAHAEGRGGRGGHRARGVQVDGIPVSKLLEAEMQKLVTWRSACASASLDKRRRCAPSPTPSGAPAAACRTRTAHRQLSLRRPHRRGQDGAGAGAGEFLFDDEQAMVRLDMSEYMEKHSVWRA